jgi:hypothetical protein
MTGSGETQANTKDEWWDHHWTYRIPLEITEIGPVSNTLNFSQILNDFGLLNAIIDLRSLQVVPYIDGMPGEPVPFEETFSHLIIDADQMSIGTPPNDMYWAFSEESTSIDIDEVRKTQGVGSLHATIEISEYSNLNTGFYFDFNNSSSSNWSNYEVLLYDIFPDVNEVDPLDLETLFLFKLDGLMNCPITYIDGPQLTNAAWNGIDLLLQSFGECQSPDYSGIDKMEFIFQRESNIYLEKGDNLDIWVDNFRMFDQDADGQIIWSAEENIDRYYLYFNLLKEAVIPVYLPIVFR